MTGHGEKAREIFKQGYNCAQSVLIAFSDLTNLDTETALKISSSFGGGMGRLREVCGAVSGMFMTAGILFAPENPLDVSAKSQHYALIQELAKRFRERNGSIICRELLAGVKKVDYSTDVKERSTEYYKKRPCAELCFDAADILDEIISERNLKINND